MSKKKKTQKQKTQSKPEQKSGMTMSEKFRIVTVACVIITAIITIALLAIFF